MNGNWKPVKEFPAYQVNKDGVVLSPRGNFIKPIKINGYLVIRFPYGRWYTRKNGRRERLSLNRGLASLVVRTFSRESKNGEILTFLNGDPHNTNIENLMWVQRVDRFKSWNRQLYCARCKGKMK